MFGRQVSFRIPKYGDMSEMTNDQLTIRLPSIYLNDDLITHRITDMIDSTLDLSFCGITNNNINELISILKTAFPTNFNNVDSLEHPRIADTRNIEILDLSGNKFDSLSYLKSILEKTNIRRFILTIDNYQRTLRRWIKRYNILEIIPSRSGVLSFFNYRQHAQLLIDCVDSLQYLHISVHAINILMSMNGIDFSGTKKLYLYKEHLYEESLKNILTRCRNLTTLAFKCPVPFDANTLNSNSNLSELEFNNIRMTYVSDALKNNTNITKLTIHVDMEYRNIDDFMIAERHLYKFKQNMSLLSVNAMYTTQLVKEKMIGYLVRNNTILWKNAKKRLLNISILFIKLFPPYVILEIFDWLPHMNHVNHLKKIRLIEGVQRVVNTFRPEVM